LKYFVLGSLSSCLMLLGICSIYCGSGSTTLADIGMIHQYVTPSDNPIVGSIQAGELLFIVGLLFKVGCAPFHQWLPDIYQGSNTKITAYLAVVTKIAVFSVIIRVYHLLFIATQMINNLGLLCLSFGVFVSILIGSFGAIKQTNLKRFIGYSSISHTGFILIGTLTNIVVGFMAQCLYIAVYIILSLSLFTTIITTKLNGKELKLIKQLIGFGLSHKAFSFSFVIILFAAAGIPPLAGFFIKLFILGSAIQSQLWFLAVVAIFSSVISTFYYVRFVKEIHFINTLRWARVETNEITPFNYTFNFNASCCAFTCSFLIYFILYPACILDFLLDFALIVC